MHVLQCDYLVCHSHAHIAVATTSCKFAMVVLMPCTTTDPALHLLCYITLVMGHEPMHCLQHWSMRFKAAAYSFGWYQVIYHRSLLVGLEVVT